MILKKYSTALLNVIGVVLTALITELSGVVTTTTLLQLALLVIGAIVTFFVPVLPTKWAGGLKTGAGILAAILTAVLPLVTQGTITPQQWLTVGLAALIALGNEIGVQIRTEPIPVTAAQAAAAPDGV